MTVLDTHIWVWWTHDDPRLSPRQRQYLEDSESRGLGVSVISCWEIAKLVELHRLVLPCPLEEWFEQALSYPGIRLLPLTQTIAIESTRLPPPFHRDPADQLIVATARVHASPLMTADEKILSYPYVAKP